MEESGEGLGMGYDSEYTGHMRYWFKNKYYGWGWRPATWQGWLIMAVYVAIVVWIFRDVDSQSHSGSDTLIGMVVPVILLTVALIVICWKTGEKPEWRWGKKKSEIRNSKHES